MGKIIEELDAIKRYILLGAKNVLTIEDVSLLTGLSKCYLYKQTSANTVPHYKHGKQLYFDRAEIEAWMKQNRVTTQEEAAQKAIAYTVTGKK